MESDKVIIYIDDRYEDIVILLKAFYEVSDFQLVGLQNSNDLFELLLEEGTNVCLIIINLNIGQQNSIDMVLELKSNQFKSIPVVLLLTGQKLNPNSFIYRLECDIVEWPDMQTDLRGLASRLLAYVP